MKKRIHLFALVLVVILLLSACSTTAASGSSAEPQATSPSEGSPQPAGEDAAEYFEDKDPSQYSGTLTLLAHSEQLNPMIEKFQEKYPGIKVEMSLVAGTEQLTKITSMVQSGVDVPDLYTCRTQFVRGLVETEGYYADLSKAPFNGNDLAVGLTPYTVDLGRDLNGDIRVLSWQAPIGGVFYRRSLAKEYFGTDDPNEISKLFTTYDQCIETAREVNEKSGGQVKAFSDFSQDLFFPMRYAGTKGWVTDGKLTIDDNMPKIFEYAKTIYDEDLDLKTVKYQNDFFQAIENKKLFCVIGPTWALNFNLMPSSPDTAGDWGLAHMPNSYNQGGTFIGIYDGCKQKELAWQFIKFLFSDEDAIKYYATTAGDYVSNTKVQQEIAALPESERNAQPTFSYMGGQNIYQFYNDELAKGVNSSIVTNYDERFDAYMIAAIKLYCDGSKTYEEAIETFKQDVATNAPEVVIE